MLQVTGLYTAILAVIMVFLAYRTAKGRGKLKVNLGTGNDPEMEKKVRAFGNFIEYVPMLILLMAVSEMQGLASYYLHAFGIATILARVLHAIGISGVKPALKGRFRGTLLTFLLLLVGSGSLLYHSVMSLV